MTPSAAPRRQRPALAAADLGSTLLRLGVGAGLAGLAVNLLLGASSDSNILYRVFYVVVAVVSASSVVALLWRNAHPLSDSTSEFQIVAEEAVAVIERALPPTQGRLDEEIADLVKTLDLAARRLQEISQRADEFGAGVRGLMQQAEDARATVDLHEDNARKIASVLNQQADATFREQIDKLMAAHADQIEKLRRSGNRSAWWTFVLGAFVGFLINLVTPLITG